MAELSPQKCISVRFIRFDRAGIDGCAGRAGSSRLTRKKATAPDRQPGFTAPLDGARSGALAALAAGAVTSAIVQILYPLERSILVFLWNFGSVLAIVCAGYLLGHLLFRAKNTDTAALSARQPRKGENQ